MSPLYLEERVADRVSDCEEGYRSQEDGEPEFNLPLIIRPFLAGPCLINPAYRDLNSTNKKSRPVILEGFTAMYRIDPQ